MRSQIFDRFFSQSKETRPLFAGRRIKPDFAVRRKNDKTTTLTAPKTSNTTTTTTTTSPIKNDKKRWLKLLGNFQTSGLVAF